MMTSEKTTLSHIILTPAGVFEAFSHHALTNERRALQHLLSANESMSVAKWTESHSEKQLAHFVSLGWVEYLDKPLTAPNMPLDEFLPYVVVSLSGNRRAAIGSNEGFCLASMGYSTEEAEKLCVAGADFFDFISRQQQRGLVIKEQAISFFSQVNLLMPSTSFVFLYIDDTGYILVLDGEPLTNNQAFVELIWAIKTSGLKFDN